MVATQYVSTAVIMIIFNIITCIYLACHKKKQLQDFAMQYTCMSMGIFGWFSFMVLGSVSLANYNSDDNRDNAGAVAFSWVFQPFLPIALILFCVDYTQKATFRLSTDPN